MERDLSSEIVLLLIQHMMHVRAIAKELEGNHTTVRRILQNLMEKNAIDYRQEGKNKVYFLKRTLEARNYVIMAETYKLNRILSRYPELRDIVEQVKGISKIRLAILFGSYAAEKAGKDSDIDIFIETRDNAVKKELQYLNSRLSVKIGLFDKSSPLIKEIKRNHVIIKGVERFYEKVEFFA
ncbi:MAG TPA: hypothetical protein EYP58_04070 [bacterium (Candidatus Stahlbacteria)]|nr:hypothetical protein [Candidatus Stahlbacteria bacterium]